MDRRAFTALVGGSMLAAPLVAKAAQESTTRPRVAFLGAESQSTNQHFLDAFRQGMREQGYVDGQNMILEARWADGRSERFPELVGELIRLKTSIILTISVGAALAAKNSTTAIPIVFIASDPLGSGLVPSLARPGGNLTGFSLFLGENFSSKWLELLREALPKISRVAVLLNRTSPASAGYLTVLQGAAQKLGIKLRPQDVQDPGQFDSAFAAMVAERAQGLIVVVDPLTVRYRGRIVELAAKNRLPAVYGFREFVDVGGLMAYGVNVPYLCRRAAVYVDKILKGASPGELPVEQPTTFELIVNLKTAKALGLTIPQTLLLRADQVIDP
jgi:putative tryptophan/tyrosine transport system substrate-binding protein